MAKLVSKVYGDALFETAMEKELVDTLYEETSALLPILQANPELFSVLGNPQIVKEEKVALLHQVFSGKIAEELMGFLSIIVEKDRQNEMISILEYFIQRVKEFKKIGAAYVTSAVELGAEQKAALEKRLLETTGYVQFEMHYDVDASLLGGMVIRIGDRVVDSSIKTRLEEIDGVKGVFEASGQLQIIFGTGICIKNKTIEIIPLMVPIFIILFQFPFSPPPQSVWIPHV